MIARAESKPRLWAGVAAMAVVVILSNVLVGFPLNDWLTCATFTFPVAFLVTDLVNRAYGVAAARRVALAGFAIAVPGSILAGAWWFGWDGAARIGLASGAAFLAGQWLDIHLFDRLRDGRWWRAPLVSSVCGSAVDTALFYSLAFYGSDWTWEQAMIGDFAVKTAVALLLLAPFRFAIGRPDHVH